MRDGRYDDAMRMSIFQEEAATSPSGFGSHQVQEAALQQMNAQRRINALRRMWALRTILMAKAGKMEQADDCYEHWQQLEGDSPIDDMEILDYLILSQHHQEAHDVIHRYREFLRAECDTINFRMINILSKDALLHAMSNDLEVSTLNSELINEIADSLHLHHSKGAMSNTYNLIMEEKHAHRQKIAIIALVSSVLVLILMGAAILYLTNKVRQRNKKLLRVLNALEAYRNIMAEQTEQSVQKPSKVKALEEEQRMFVEIDARVTNERPFTDPDFDHESLIRFSGIDEELFVRMMARYTHALNSLSYINSRRAEYGARLIIEHPHENIDAIAKACGFKGTDAFNRAFKFALGVTPSEYRNSMVKMFKDEQ